MEDRSNELWSRGCMNVCTILSIEWCTTPKEAIERQEMRNKYGMRDTALIITNANIIILYLIDTGT